MSDKKMGNQVSGKVRELLAGLNEALGELEVNAIGIGYKGEKDDEPDMYFWYTMPGRKIKDLANTTLHIEIEGKAVEVT